MKKNLLRLFFIIVFLSSIQPNDAFAQTITGFTPSSTTAGTGSILTINGTGFGTGGPNSTNYVEFTGASAGEGFPFVKPDQSEYISWTDTKILVNVTSDAGTGVVRVINGGTTIVSSTSLTVNFDLENAMATTRVIPKLINSNNDGGYTFQMFTNFNANTGANQAFLRALKTWKCATNVNWNVGSPTNVSAIGDDGINIIRFAIPSDNYDVGVAGEAIVWSNLVNNTFQVTGIDFIFAANSTINNWSFGPQLPGNSQEDFETVALHELGHAQGLGHVNDINDVMNVTGRLNTIRTLTTNDIDAGNYLMSLSTTGSSSPIIALPTGSCNDSLPIINSFSPTNGSPGDVITITGTGFTDVTGVSFGGVPASSFSLVSPTSITAVLASGSSGSVNVATAGGIADLTGFTFVPLSSQTITFPTFPTKTIADADFDPGATASSGLPITYTSSNPSIAIISNGKIHIIGVGSTIITASQIGNSIFNPATNVSQSLTITLQNQTITFSAFPIKTTADADFVLNATASSGLPITYSNSNFILGPVVLTNNTIHIVNVGTTIITASQSGNSSYNPAPSVSQILTIFPVPSIIANGPTTFVTGSNVILTASSGINYTYVWTKDGTDINGATGLTCTVSTSGSYTVSIISGSTRITSAAIIINAVFTLPATNFELTITSASCKGSNNGSINITAAQALNYTATITGNGLNTAYPFTASQDINNLAAGTYNICITVAGQSGYQQCFDVVITEPQDLSVYSLVNISTNTLNLALSGGTLYNIELNGVAYTTTNNAISLPLKAGNNDLSVTTDRLCQGSVKKLINVSDKIVPYPDPFKNTLSVNLGLNTKNNVSIRIVSLPDGTLVFSKQYGSLSGVIQLDLGNLRPGAYSLQLSSDNSANLFKIVKQ